MEKAKAQCYNDGLCSIWTQDADENYIRRYENLRFADRVVGMSRYFAAMQDQFVINRLIRIPRVPEEITPFHDRVVINGDQYEIVQVQHIPDAMPPSIDITLKQAEQYLDFGGVESG